MTKVTFFIALGVYALAAPAFAQHSGYAPMVGASDPCVLGTNVQPGACVGPVRVAPMIMSQGYVNQGYVNQGPAHQGPVQLQPAHQGASQGYASQAVYASQPIATYVQPVAYSQPMPTQPAPVQMSGCVSGYGGPRVPCNGVWVPAPSYAPQPVMVQAAPQYMPEPVAYAPQPQQVSMIPTSFFTGGITYGAGFPTDTSYSNGGGGFGYSTGGGTRFSGVRERSPTPLVAPPRRQRHAPPPTHHHGCC